MLSFRQSMLKFRYGLHGQIVLEDVLVELELVLGALRLMLPMAVLHSVVRSNSLRLAIHTAVQESKAMVKIVSWVSGFNGPAV